MKNTPPEHWPYFLKQHRALFPEQYNDSSIDDMGHLIPVILVDYQDKRYLLSGNSYVQHELSKATSSIQTLTVGLDDMGLDTFVDYIFSILPIEHWPLVSQLIILADLTEHLGRSIWPDYLKRLGIQSHSVNHHKIHRILQLPASVLALMSAKKYTFKQVAQLAHYPHTLVEYWVSQINIIQLTASNLNLLCDQCNDLMNRHRINLDTLLTQLDWDALVEDSIPPHERTRRLRVRLQAQLHPTITHYNQQLDHLSSQIKDHYHIQWDRALEQKELSISFTFRDTQELDSFQQWLTQSKPTFNQMLEIL